MSIQNSHYYHAPEEFSNYQNGPYPNSYYPNVDNSENYNSHCAGHSSLLGQENSNGGSDPYGQEIIISPHHHSSGGVYGDDVVHVGSSSQIIHRPEPNGFHWEDDRSMSSSGCQRSPSCDSFSLDGITGPGSLDFDSLSKNGSHIRKKGVGGRRKSEKPPSPMVMKKRRVAANARYFFTFRTQWTLRFLFSITDKFC